MRDELYQPVRRSAVTIISSAMFGALLVVIMTGNVVPVGLVMLSVALWAMM